VERAGFACAFIVGPHGADTLTGVRESVAIDARAVVRIP